MAIKILFFLILIKVYLDSANLLLLFYFCHVLILSLYCKQNLTKITPLLKVTEYRNLKYRQYTTRSLSKKLQIQQTTAEVVLSS